MKEKYVLTYELRILYCPDVQLNLMCKEFNLSNFQFTLFDGDRSDLETGFELYPNEINTIASDILMGKIGYELSQKQMNWLEKYEEKLKDDISLILNKKVTYNYFILKLRLLGFKEEIAKEMVSNYYRMIESNKKVQHPQIFLKNINKFLSKKIFWVTNNLEKEKNIEYTFFEKVIESKFELGYKFSFDQLYKEQYLNMEKNGIVNTLLQFTQKPSYLVRKKYQVTNLVPYVTKVYKNILKQIITDIYAKYHLIPNESFIDDITKQIIAAARLYISLYF